MLYSMENVSFAVFISEAQVAEFNGKRSVIVHNDDCNPQQQFLTAHFYCAVLKRIFIGVQLSIRHNINMSLLQPDRYF